MPIFACASIGLPVEVGSGTHVGTPPNYLQPTSQLSRNQHPHRQFAQ
jgi:hypothetical protein